MRIAHMLLKDVLELLRMEGLAFRVDERKDRAVLIMFDKHQRDYAFERLAEYLKKHSRCEGELFLRRMLLEEIRGPNIHWVVGRNLSEEQFNAAICRVIANDGYAINVI